MKKIILALMILWTLALNAQCTVVSTDGYTVHLNLTITNLIVHNNPCPSGYNFDFGINYNITFSGVNIPPSLYTLQGNVLIPGYSNSFYDLPNSGGAGNTVTVGNVWTTQTNCATANVGFFNPSIQIIIEGPGISYRVISCPAVALSIQDFSNSPITISRESSLYFFPNPNNGYLNMSGNWPNDEEIELSIFNTNWGLEVAHCISPINGKISKEIPLDLKSGLYFLQVKQYDFIKYYKLIVSK